MTKDEVIKKIKKLYVMAERGTPEESKNALMLAKKLIAKYNIEQLEFNINHGLTEKNINTCITDIPARVKLYVDELARIIAENYRCTSYFSVAQGKTKKRKGKRVGSYTKCRLAFAGLPTDLSTCLMSFDFANKLCERSERRHYQSSYRKGYKYQFGTFTMGFIHGLRQAYEEQARTLVKEDLKYEMVLLKPEALLQWESSLGKVTVDYKDFELTDIGAYIEGQKKGYYYGSEKESISKGYELL